SGLNSPGFFVAFTLPNEDGGGNLLAQDNGWGHIYNASSGAQNFTWSTQNNTAGVQDWAAKKVAYKAAAADDDAKAPTPPDTTITAAPPARSTSSSASFSFTATEAGSSFACQLDASAFAACVSPQSYSGLTDGSHSFQVRATDPAGNTDPTPASYTWTVDTTPPDTTITAAPPARSTSSSASFSFTATEAGSSF